MLDLSIVFPAYNEVERIQPTLESYNNVLSKLNYSYELLVVDDGSKDGTAAFVYSLKEKMPNIRVIICPENKGKGNAVRVGMLKSKGRIRVMTDSDGSTPAYLLERLLDPIFNNKADITIGSRYMEGAVVHNPQPFYRRWWSRFANSIIQQTLLPGIVDTQCGFKAFRASVAEAVFEKTTINGWSFDLEVLAIAQLYESRIQEIPVDWTDDERSKGHWTQLPKTILELFRIKKRLNEEVRLLNG